MAWYVYLDSGVAVADSEANSRIEAIEVAISAIREWFDHSTLDPATEIVWRVEKEEE